MSENTIEKDDILEIIQDMLDRIKVVESELLLAKKRITDLENP